MLRAHWLAVLASTTIACALPHADLRGDASVSADMVALPDVVAAPDSVALPDVSCAAGQSVCDGACVDLQVNLSHCGACRVACGAGQACVAGLCRGTCAAPSMMCGASCIDVRSDPMNCGACGMRCAAGQVCSDGACAQTCALTTCGAACVNLQTTQEHCGSCNNACNSTRTCTLGRCECLAGTADCGGTCVNRMTDNSNCGACGAACPAGQTCTGGACRCSAGQHFCSPNCVSDTSPNSCGTSCTPCATPADGTATCVGGTCGIACNSGFTMQGGRCVPTCPSGQHLCDTRCVPNDSTMSCGSLCTPCPAPMANGRSTCVGGACGIQCDPNFVMAGSMCTGPSTCGNGALDPGEDCDDGVRPPAAGDGCSTSCLFEANVGTASCAETRAPLIIGLNQTIRLRSATSGMRNNLDACGGGRARGPEMIFALRTATAGRIRSTLRPTGASWDIAFRGGDTCPGQCLNSAGAGVAEGPVTTTGPLPAGSTFLLIADGVGMNESGSFELETALIP